MKVSIDATFQIPDTLLFGNSKGLPLKAFDPTGTFSMVANAIIERGQLYGYSDKVAIIV